jgi:two-component system response regulator YesN
MFNLMLIDDEMYALQAILKRMVWSELDIAHVYLASDADEAKQQLQLHTIDIVVCDIEMPGDNGLVLVEWMNEHYPSVVSIFLTGHADFTYAQKAVHLNSLDYLLKPVKLDQLVATLKRAVDKVKKEKEFYHHFDKYRNLWTTQKPMLSERFWQDLLAERFIPTEKRIKQRIQELEMPIEPSVTIYPVLLSIEEWTTEFSSSDEGIMEYAIRNAAKELIVASCEGEVLQDRNGFNLVLIYVNEESPPANEDIRKRCELLIDACRQYFYCSLSCYVGEPSDIRLLSSSVHKLIELEQDNLVQSRSVFFTHEAHPGDQMGNAVLSVDLESWTTLLEMGKRDELLQRLNEVVSELKAKPISSETLSALYHSLTHLIYDLAHKKGFSVKGVMGGKRGIEDPSAIRSLLQWRGWATRVITMWCDFVEKNDSKNSAIIEKVKSYINSHLREVTREDLAAHVYLNSAHLSRLFKKETGCSIMDYIIQAKMAHAKYLLTETEHKICTICEMLGYENFSYFGKMFKRHVGITPQEYRKRYYEFD